MSNSEKFDQYYTKQDIAKKCCLKLKEILPKCATHIFLEPSAGTGSFIDAIYNVFGDVEIKAYDIEPKRKDIIKADFLTYELQEKNMITVGNPPFGKRSSLAVQFFNRAADKSDVIAFILPVQFEKYGIHKQLNKDYKLIYSERLPKYSFVYKGKDCDIHCVFQIWTSLKTKYKDLRITEAPKISHPDFEMFLYNNTKQALKFFDKDKYKWDFAVPRQGFYDYSLRIENEKDLNAKIQYVFFKSDNKAVLNKLRNLDFYKLSKNNTTIPGYGKADVVKAYMEKE